MSETRNLTGPLQLPPEAQLSVSAPHRVSMPLVGRDHEIGQLDGIFARAVEYQAPQLVTVVGTQGTGKTRLVAEWLARLLARQAAGTAGRPRVYRGRAVAGSGSYALISRILRDRFGIHESDDEARRQRRCDAVRRRLRRSAHGRGRALFGTLLGAARSTRVKMRSFARSRCRRIRDRKIGSRARSCAASWSSTPSVRRWCLRVRRSASRRRRFADAAGGVGGRARWIAGPARRGGAAGAVRAAARMGLGIGAIIRGSTCHRCRARSRRSSCVACSSRRSRCRAISSTTPAS